VHDICGHLLKGAERHISVAMDAAFDRILEGDFAENGRKMVVDTSEPNKRRTRKPIQAAGKVVEMCGFEPQTPYMRSKCSTS
jgi:hypothetical protein